jgi:hypothetical protein
MGAALGARTPEEIETLLSRVEELRKKDHKALANQGKLDHLASLRKL